jgi:hypothetical protein
VNKTEFSLFEVVRVIKGITPDYTKAEEVVQNMWDDSSYVISASDQDNIDDEGQPGSHNVSIEYLERLDESQLANLLSELEDIMQTDSTENTSTRKKDLSSKVVFCDLSRGLPRSFINTTTSQLSS